MVDQVEHLTVDERNEIRCLKRNIQPPISGEKSALHNATGVDRENREWSGQDTQRTPRMALRR